MKKRRKTSQQVTGEKPLTGGAGKHYHLLSLLDLGFEMKGIRPEGKCPVCKGPFKADKEKGYICPEHLTKPDRFTISIFWKGERIFRGTTLEGQTLRSFADAYALLKQADKEKDAFKFDPARWKSKTILQFAFNHLIDAWYKDKEDEMNRGDLAPSYVPKLKTYIEHYYRPFFGDTDVREILSLKPFQKQLPDKLSPKYRQNITNALIGFFRT